MTEKEIIQKIYEVIKLVDCMQYNPSIDFNYLRAKGAYNIIKNQIEHIEAENAEHHHRTEVAERQAVVLSKWLAEKTRKDYPWQAWFDAAQKQAEKELAKEERK